MPTRAVLFDLDDTVAVDEAVVREALLATCERARERHGIEPPELMVSVRRQAHQLWHASPMFAYCEAIGISSWEGLCASFAGDDPNLRSLRAWGPAYRLESWSRALAEHGALDSSLAQELAETFPRERLRGCRVFPETEAVLRNLRSSGYRLGMITNGAPDLQRAKLEGAGLAPHFDIIVVSGEVGVGKPDPRVFELTLRALDVRPSEAVMVGDNPARDVLGAVSAGVRVVWVNRTQAARAGGAAVADAEIGSLSELADLLLRG